MPTSAANERIRNRVLAAIAEAYPALREEALNQITADRKFLQLFKEDTKMPAEYYYSVPGAGAITKAAALKEYRRRTQPCDRGVEWIDGDNCLVGIMWEGKHGSVETVRFADMTEQERRLAGLKPSGV